MTLFTPERVAPALAGPGREVLLTIAAQPYRHRRSASHAASIPVPFGPVCPTCGGARASHG